jgi:hypothetical protein
MALVKGNDSIALAKKRSLETGRAYDALVARREKLLEQYKEVLPPPIVLEEEIEIISRCERLFRVTSRYLCKIRRTRQACCGAERAGATKSKSKSSRAMNLRPSRRPRLISSDWTVMSVGLAPGKGVPLTPS